MKKLILNKDHISKFEDEEFARLLIYYYKYYQQNYNYWEFDHFRRSASRPSSYDPVWYKRFILYGGHRIKWGLINQLYFEGNHVLKKIKCSYFEFCDFMIYGVPSEYYSLVNENYSHYNSWFWRRGWSSRNDFKNNHFRKKQKYQKRKGHTKKVKTEDQIKKEEWRKVNKVPKDKSKPNYRRRKSCPKDYKRMANKSHRRWQKNNIQKENWEELMDTKKLDFLQDPWGWD